MITLISALSGPSGKGRRGLHHQVSYTPPESPFGLVQEQLHSNPWQLLVATIFLNRTAGKVALPVLWKFFQRWPTPERLLKEEWQNIAG